ncbi:MAG: ExeA family protein, partial [Marinicellaceae bacterium]
MYLDFFGFDEPPFSITPDPRFVFLSKKHEESLAHLVYGITRGGGAGFVQLTGEVGTGKTTISRLLLEQIPEKTNIALILNPTITPIELLEYICKELKVPLRGIKGKLNSMVDKLNDYLLKSWSEGENTVVIIDEAQNLPR